MDDLADRRKMVAEMSRDGWSLTRIAEHFGVSRSTVSHDRKLTGSQRVMDEEYIIRRRKMVAEMSRDGWSPTRMAQHLEVSKRTISRDLSKLRGSRRIKAPCFSDDEYHWAETLLEDGCSLEDVARTLHRAPCTIIKRFKGRGWTVNEVSAYNAMRRWEKRLLDG
jgi:IS30 family transposase